MTLPVQPPVAPMLAKLTRELPRAEGMFYEPKWDGFRCIVFRDGDEVELGSRNEKPLTRYFPELVEAAPAEPPRPVRARRRDRHRRSHRARLRRPVPADPPGRVADQPAGRDHAGLVRGLRPPRRGRRRPLRYPVRRAPRQVLEKALTTAKARRCTSRRRRTIPRWPATGSLGSRGPASTAWWPSPVTSSTCRTSGPC